MDRKRKSVVSHIIMRNTLETLEIIKKKGKHKHVWHAKHIKVIHAPKTGMEDYQSETNCQKHTDKYKKNIHLQLMKNQV